MLSGRSLFLSHTIFSSGADESLEGLQSPQDYHRGCDHHHGSHRRPLSCPQRAQEERLGVRGGREESNPGEHGSISM